MAKKGMLTAAAVLKIKPAADRREFRCRRGRPVPGHPAVRSKGLGDAIRRPNGVRAKLVLGPLDATGKEMAGDPQIGQPLTPAAARALAGQINRRRAMGIAIYSCAAIKEAPSRHRQLRGRRQALRGPPRPTENPTLVMLGLEYPLDGDGEPTTIKGSLFDRWSDRPIAEIDGDDIHAIVDEFQYSGIPGLGRKNKAASDARGRSMADALGTMFGWLKKNRRIETNPSIDVHRPGPPPAP